jgi:2-keto-4-pentenoate hydratase/2-oxohepta-3-ene-1,7-dioic acid hydratase in catechol pathway
MLRDGLNFMGHLKGWSAKMNRALPESVERIVPYTQMSPTMNYGHEAVIEWPGYVKRMDYELELGWVIGRKGRNITPDVARDYVFGITMYNDWSGRDLQADELPIGMGGTKSKQFAHSIGPWITTMDEFKDFYSIEMEVRLNGKTMGKGLSDGVVWTVEEQIAFVALGEYIQPGDVIGSGTLGGGSALEHDVFLKPGDVIELEAKGVGVLRNTLGQPVEGLWWPTPQPGIMKT